MEKEANKKRKNQDFRNAWLDEDSFKGWLTPHFTDNKAFCNICCKAITCCKSKLLKVENNNENILSYENNNRNILSHNDKVKREIKLAAFFVEHNIAFNIADHLIPLLKDICIDPEIVSDLSLARDKCKNIITNVIAKREVNKINYDLQICKFSILIDESTDISDTKIICVLVKYLSSLNKKITIKLKAYHYKIVGMTSDNTSVMIGCNNSFMSPCEKLPECKNLIRGVSSYISGSAKRCAILVEFQNFFNIGRNKILKLCNIR
ncbi:hypothetical protein P5V15_011716 [Pogonomyrmex californicus]